MGGGGCPLFIQNHSGRESIDSNGRSLRTFTYIRLGGGLHIAIAFTYVQKSEFWHWESFWRESFIVICYVHFIINTFISSEMMWALAVNLRHRPSVTSFVLFWWSRIFFEQFRFVFLNYVQKKILIIISLTDTKSLAFPAFINT